MTLPTDLIAAGGRKYLNYVENHFQGQIPFEYSFNFGRRFAPMKLKGVDDG